MKTFADWWFYSGGMLHRHWKRRQYSEIMRLAETLPREAWEARQPEIDLLKNRVNSLYAAIAHGDADHRKWLKTKICDHFGITAETAELWESHD